MSSSTTDGRATVPHGIRQTAVLAWLRLARVYQKVEHAASDSLRCSGLSLAQFDVLAHVGADEGMTQQELADSLLVTKGNVCQLLDRMERAGIVQRRQDGRSNQLYLTDGGRTLFAQIVPAHEAVVARQLDGLSAEEQAQLLSLLRKLERSLSPFDHN